MAVNYAQLNRHQEWSTPQKASLKKVFTAAEAAATGGDSTLVSALIVHRAMGGRFSAQEYADIRRLMQEIRDASDAADNARDISTVMGAFSLEGSKREILRTMANAVIAQIV
jgi:hypothetical protein